MTNGVISSDVSPADHCEYIDIPCFSDDYSWKISCRRLVDGTDRQLDPIAFEYDRETDPVAVVFAADAFDVRVVQLRDQCCDADLDLEFDRRYVFRFQQLRLGFDRSGLSFDHQRTGLGL